MLVHKAYKYRIYPNPEQRQLIHQMFGCCRFIFNHFLDKWSETYAATGKGLSEIAGGGAIHGKASTARKTTYFLSLPY
ncbi:Helix-turn-helix domain protein [compost metagenome]